ncbi:hypothetical protein EZS27_041322, partial [termite gut metagenome]
MEYYDIKEAIKKQEEKEKAADVKCTPKVGQIKNYVPCIRARYCTGLFPFNLFFI